MSDRPRLREDAYGFTWFPEDSKVGIYVQRTATINGAAILHVGVEDMENRIEVYVSPAGRSLRVFRDGKELEADDE